MIVVDPVQLGDVAFSRASPKWVFDRTGTLVQVPADTVAITYDPADLNAAPYVLIEPAATNLTLWGEQITHPYWVKRGACFATQDAAAAPDGAVAMDLMQNVGVAGTNDFYNDEYQGGVPGTRFEPSFFIRRVSTSGYLAVNNASGGGYGQWVINLSLLPDSTVRITRDHPAVVINNEFVSSQISGNGVHFFSYTGASLAFYMWGVQTEHGTRSTGYIKSTYAVSFSTRAADVIGATTGLLYSNVPEPEPLWTTGTYAKGATLRNEAHVAFESLVDANIAPLTDASKWLKLGATNRWAAFDDRNNTQTSSAEEIILVLSPRAIAQGLFLGNVDGSELTVSVAVPNFGVVHRETSSLIMSTSNSSFFRWCFNRIRRKTSFLSLNLPNFYNGLVTVTIRRPGGVAKCGMCMIGPTVEPGPTLVGLSTEIKDYSTTSFNVDGSSSTIERGYRKLMSLDVVIDTANIEQAEDQMIAWRQKTAVWIGAASRPDSIICGRYSSFKKVIESYPRSKMALQIEGVLS